MLTWLHIGALHASSEDGWESVDHLAAIAREAAAHLRSTVDFAYLPGDNANHGEVRVAEGGGRAREPVRDCLGHDRHAIGAWEHHGVLGTGLGPNKHGRKW